MISVFIQCLFFDCGLSSFTKILIKDLDKLFLQLKIKWMK